VAVNLGLAALVLVVALVLLGRGRLRVYTDGRNLQEEARDVSLRLVLWGMPMTLGGRVNAVPGIRDAAVSVDGRILVLSRKTSEENADLYVSSLESGVWGTPRPLATVNSPFHEMGPELSLDGRHLFFHSNRPGGKGGFDLWCATRRGNQWAPPVNLGDKVNTAFNELDAAVSPDERRLFFSSDRPTTDAAAATPVGGKDLDIYMAYAKRRSWAEEEASGSDVPLFFPAEPLTILNSSYNEGQVAVVSRGNVLYLSSDRPGGLGGWDIYRSLHIGGQFLPPENVAAPVNTPYDELNPTLALEGFGLFFGSNRPVKGEQAFLLYRSMSREVVGRSNLDLLADIVRLLIVAALAWGVLVYLLRLLLDKQWRLQHSLFHTCMLCSILAHAVIAFVASLWLLTSKLHKAMHRESVDVKINLNAMVKESIALAIRESVSALPKLEPAPAVGRRMDSIRVPGKRPAKVSRQAVSGAPRADTRTVQSGRLARASDAEEALEPTDVAAHVAPGKMQAPQIRMETPGSAQRQGPTGSQSTQFVPSPVQPQDKKMDLDVLKIAKAPMKVAQANVHVAAESFNQDIATAVTNAWVPRTDVSQVGGSKGKRPLSAHADIASMAPTHKTFGDVVGSVLFQPGIMMETPGSRAQGGGGIGLGALEEDKERVRRSPLEHDMRLKPAKLERAEPGDAQMVRERKDYAAFDLTHAGKGAGPLGRVGNMVSSGMPNLLLSAEPELEIRDRPRPGTGPEKRAPGPQPPTPPRSPGR
jgi:hypothetical protein